MVPLYDYEAVQTERQERRKNRSTSVRKSEWSGDENEWIEKEKKLKVFAFSSLPTSP